MTAESWRHIFSREAAKATKFKPKFQHFMELARYTECISNEPSAMNHEKPPYSNFRVAFGVGSS